MRNVYGGINGGWIRSMGLESYVREKEITWLRSLIKLDSYGFVRNVDSGQMKGEGTFFFKCIITRNLTCLTTKM